MEGECFFVHCSRAKIKALEAEKQRTIPPGGFHGALVPLLDRSTTSRADYLHKIHAKSGEMERKIRKKERESGHFQAEKDVPTKVDQEKCHGWMGRWMG